MNYMDTKVMTNRQGKKTKSQKILEYLQENLGEVSNEELAREIEIDKSNIPREIKKIENLGYKISRRYEQIGRSKYVWFQLTNRQGKKTKSQIQKSKKKVIKSKIIEPKSKAISESSILKSNSEIKNNNVLTISQKREHIPPRFIEQMAQEVVIFGRTIPLDKVREIARKTLENHRNMIKGLKYYLNAWESRYNKYKIEKPDNFLIDEYENMEQTLRFLYEIKEINEKLKNIKKEHEKK